MYDHKHCKCCGVVIPLERATWLCDQCPCMYYRPKQAQPAPQQPQCPDCNQPMVDGENCPAGGYHLVPRQPRSCDHDWDIVQMCVKCGLVENSNPPEYLRV